MQDRQSIAVRNADGSRSPHFAYGESHIGWAVEICRMRRGLKLIDHHGTIERKRELKNVVDRHLHDVRARITFDDAGEPKITFEPLTLISAMWLQLASALTVGKCFVTCKFCKRMFEISTEQTGFRSHREFCTDSCKTLHYRHRKRTAIQLAGRGMPVAAIADRIQTNKATVAKWLAELKKPPARGLGG